MMISRELWSMLSAVKPVLFAFLIQTCFEKTSKKVKGNRENHASIYMICFFLILTFLI